MAATPQHNPDDGMPPDPRKLTPALIEAFATLLSEGNFRSDTCRYLGIGHRTFKRWMSLGKRFPQGIYGTLRHQVIGAEAAAIRLAVRCIQSAGTEDAKHMEWFLERKYPQKWGKYRGELGELKRRIAELEGLLGVTGETADSQTE